MPQPTRPRLSWLRLFTLAVLAAYAYAFMEWLFYATKPSFMDALPIVTKLEIFLLTGLALAMLALPCLAVLRVLGWVPGPSRKWQIFQVLAASIPALFVAGLSLLLIDNFTYTVFKFGVVTSTGIWRGVYALLALALLAAWYRQTLIELHSPPAAWQKVQSWLALVLLVASLGFGASRAAAGATVDGEGSARLKRQPHIILLGGEGVISSQMSLYGYERDTTPRLRGLAETGLLAENNYTNASHTTGSVFSILTGKYPARTRLLYSPNILQGEDAYQHLPGILQRAGYTTVQVTFPYYIDAHAVNLQDGFDEINGRPASQGMFTSLVRRLHVEDAGYFLPQLSNRVIDRLLHAFFVRDMPDPYRQVTQAGNPNQAPKFSDQERVDRLIQLLLETDRPLFVHVHLMDTHGQMFHPRKRVFSAGQQQSAGWMTDFYDDAVLDFDAYVGEVLDALTRRGLLDQTVIVVYSDHVDQWRTNGRIPLLMRFPRGEFSGRIRSNTQNLDIAPTLLDYLGMETPAWMPGQSLLAGEPAATRPIISAGLVGVECRPPDFWCVVDPNLVRPPFHQFGYLQVVVCQEMYTLDLNNDKWSQVEVAGHTAPCQAGDLPDQARVRTIMLEHLTANGFDISTLAEPPAP